MPKFFLFQQFFMMTNSLLTWKKNLIVNTFLAKHFVFTVDGSRLLSHSPLLTVETISNVYMSWGGIRKIFNKLDSNKAFSQFMVKPQTSDIGMTQECIRVTYEWHTSTYESHTDDIRVYTSHIRMTYKWHTSDIRMTYDWHTDDIRAHTSDIRMTFEWYTSTYDDIQMT